MARALVQIPPSAALYDAALEGLTRLDEEILSSHDLPPLYESGVRYKTEPREVWRHAADVAGEGWGDCEDLSAWRAAELRLSGEDPDARVATYQSGPRRYHAVVARGDGTIEDPSRVLGMGRKRMDELEPMAVIGDDPTPDVQEVTFDVRPAPGGGWMGIVRVPFRLPSGEPSGRALYTTSSRAKSKDDAASKALRLATKALDSPAAQALLPPPAKLALNVLKSPIAKQAGGMVKKLKFW